jgi:putative NADH-flavin reductase
MKIALIGASGFVGKAVLHELLERKHQVTAIVRHPEKLNSAENLTVSATDVMDQAALAEVLKGHDAIISSYNAGWTNPNLYEDFLKGSQSIQEAAKKAGVKRLLVIGGAGSLYIAPGQQLVDTEAFPKEYKPGALAARDYLNQLKEENELDWTFLSPAIEMNPMTAGIRRGSYRTGLDNPVMDENGHSLISVEDMAIAIVDEIEQPKHIRKRFTVAY